MFVIVCDVFSDMVSSMDLIFSKPKSVLWGRRLTIPCRSFDSSQLEKLPKPNTIFQGQCWTWGGYCIFGTHLWVHFFGLAEGESGKMYHLQMDFLLKMAGVLQLTKFTQKVGLTVDRYNGIKSIEFLFLKFPVSTSMTNKHKRPVHSNHVYRRQPSTMTSAVEVGVELWRGPCPIWITVEIVWWREIQWFKSSF